MDYMNILFFLVFGFVFYFFFIRQDNKKKDLFLDGLKRGDRVITTSGFCGYFHSFEGEYVIITTDKNGRDKFTFLKGSLWIDAMKKNVQLNKENK